LALAEIRNARVLYRKYVHEQRGLGERVKESIVRRALKALF
jgi:hypothetical protein